MRLAEIYDRCKRCYENNREEMNRVKVYLGEDGKNVENIKDIGGSLNRIISNYENLREIDGLKYLFNELDIVMNDEEMRKDVLPDILYRLQTSLQCIISFLQSIGVNGNELELDIKMPPTDNITDFCKYVEDLEFIFTKCPFFYSDKESLKLKSVDIGSIWLVIIVVGATAHIGSALLNNIAAFVDKCFILKSHKLTCEQQKNEIEKAEIDQQQKEEIFRNINEVYQISVKNAIRELEDATAIEIKDNEDLQRVSQSFDRLEKLLDKGLQIHAAINSPEEVKAVFEPIEMHYLPKNDNIPKIEKKSDGKLDE